MDKLHSTPENWKPLQDRTLPQTPPLLSVGIDVAKAHLDVAVVAAPAPRPHPAPITLVARSRVPNTPAGHSTLLSWLADVGVEPSEAAPPGATSTGARVATIVFEATGSYHSRLAAALEGAGLAFAIINPLQGRRYAQMKLQRSKTDRVDAELLACYGLEQQPPPHRGTTPVEAHLKQLYRQVRHLVKVRTMLRNRAHALAQQAHPCPAACTATAAVLACLEEQIAELEREQTRMLAEAFPVQSRCIASVKGVGARTTLALLAVCGDLRRFPSAKELVAFVGLDPRLWETGTYRGQVHISKRGHGDVRGVLYMGAMAAAQSNRACRRLYRRLRARGKTGKQAQVAVANKLLRQIHAVATKGCLFDNEYEPHAPLTA